MVVVVIVVAVYSIINSALPAVLYVHGGVGKSFLLFGVKVGKIGFNVPKINTFPIR